ncbi:hypothetical protein EYF80_016676 [Liparis tanakae]|uniref:Uncharacterized protein n=1 Tax=Liparis tanakae TaxID=230148 RepID=A0A4Z2I5U4_9TELE|nr:hypothetical protein EYF80_016676 [Liparis tanakae]
MKKNNNNNQNKNRKKNNNQNNNKNKKKDKKNVMQDAEASPSCVQAPSRLMMFLCLPIIFIISISDTRSDKSLSVASSEDKTKRGMTL